MNFLKKHISLKQMGGKDHCKMLLIYSCVFRFVREILFFFIKEKTQSFENVSADLVSTYSLTRVLLVATA